MDEERERFMYHIFKVKSWRDYFIFLDALFDTNSSWKIFKDHVYLI